MPINGIKMADEKIGVVQVHMREHIESMQNYASNSSVWAHDKLTSLTRYIASLWQEMLQNENVALVRSGLATNWHVFVEFVKRNGTHVHAAYVQGWESYVRKGVPRQAIVFGVAGLLTGAVVGSYLGYALRPSFSSQLGSPDGNAYLMRSIFSTNSRRGIDGLTMCVIPGPSISHPKEVLVLVKAVGIDNVDFKILNGYAKILRRHMGIPNVKEPIVLGRECSGIIVDMGHQVKSLEINDKVWVSVPIWIPLGLMSEYVVLDEKYVAKKPHNISFEEAATLPYAFCTFWNKVVASRKMDSHSARNKRVLIHFDAASKNDGVGLLATQILKTWGARITISTEEIDDENESSSVAAQMRFLHTLKSLGAESHLIIPNEVNQISNLAQRIFDVVINTDSTRLSSLLQKFCKDPDATVIETFPIELESVSTGFLSCLLRTFFTSSLQKQERKNLATQKQRLEECRKLVESGYLVPVVGKTFLPSQYDQAFRYVSASSTSAQAHVGKSVVIFK